jgi:2-hydroxy-6-oxonona-2,4-dienedioate hydrolase
MDEQRYREAERRLWEAAGVSPVEHRVHLSRNDVEVRVQEVGSGPPVLFIHGGPGASGSMFAELAARLPQLRCLLLDRPGTGLSDPHPLTDPVAVRREAETLVVDVLDALGLERAHLVGSSHGSYVALLSAAAHPERIGRTVHLGCPGFAEGMTIRSSDRLVLLPGAARVFSRFPMNERSVLTTMRQMGHGDSVDAGRFSPELLQLSVAMARHTDTMRNELESMANMGSFRRGFDASLTIGADVLGNVTSPTHFLWGANDAYGGEAVGRRMVGLLPEAEIEVLPGAGHLVWFDDGDRAADVVRSHVLA